MLAKGLRLNIFLGWLTFIFGNKFMCPIFVLLNLNKFLLLLFANLIFIKISRRWINCGIKQMST